MNTSSDEMRSYTCSSIGTGESGITNKNVMRHKQIDYNVLKDIYIVLYNLGIVSELDEYETATTTTSTSNAKLLITSPSSSLGKNGRMFPRYT